MGGTIPGTVKSTDAQGRDRSAELVVDTPDGARCGSISNNFPMNRHLPRLRTFRRWAQLGLPLVLALPTGACADSVATAETTATTQPASPAPDGPTAVLAGLRVAPEGPRTGYQRELFEHWVDADRDGCNTREEVLISESRTAPQVDPYGCRVLEADWYSLYDGLTFTDPAEVDIDHMVPLAEAWDSGASSWDRAQRRAFANDLDHMPALRAVSASANRSKSDLDPGQWKPTRDSAWCEYANDWVTLKKAWDLAADQNEVDDLRVMLRTCEQPAP
jgi:hypothetical protein